MRRAHDLLATGHAITRLARVEPLDTIEIEPVAVAVGEAPGHVSIAADDHRRNARQRETGDVDLAAGCGGIVVHQPRAKPQRRRAQAQVHVVGDDRAVVGGQRACHGEIVAARRGLFGFDVFAIRGRHRQLAQVQRFRAGQGDIAAYRADHRRVPLGAVGSDQAIQRLGHDLANLPQRELARIGFVLQVEEHRVTGQRGVGRHPRTR